jgi:hypothetical protein
MYELERLVEGVPFEVLDQNRYSIGLVLAFPRLWPGSRSVGAVFLIDKGAVGFNEFLYRRPETACKEARMDSLITHF